MLIENLLTTTFIIFAAFLGLEFRFLSRSGSIAAVFVGLFIYYGVGINGLLLLGIFFVTSSLWSVYRRKEKKNLEDKHAKGSQRDYQQVLANGGMAAVISLLYVFLQSNHLLVAFCVFLASSNSDTWSSEIGTLSKKRPFSIRTFTLVDRGTSGAVSIIGTTAGMLGAFVIAISAYFLFELQPFDLMVIFLFGFLGNVIDTLLGAFLQALYVCPICGTETEKNVHCQSKTQLIRGASILNNDVVNFVSGFAPAIAVMFLY